MVMETLLELKTLFTEHPLFLVGFLLLFGYLAGKAASRIHLPEISGFILAGLLVNSFTTGIVTHEMNRSLHVITEVAIGFLALTIGSEFSVRKMRRIGKEVLTIALVHLCGTFVVVLAGCMALNAAFPAFNIGYPYAILLAVIACATSPAVIVAEVHHLRAQGRFVDYLFGVVALGDAITVVIFGLAFTFVINILGAVESFSLISQSILEIVYSIVCGAVFAFPLSAAIRRMHNSNEIMIVTIGFICVTTGFSIVLHLSPLLVNMTMGAAMINFSSRNQRIFYSIEPLTPPIYALFFVIAGLEIDPRIFISGMPMLIAILYILLRIAGKQLSTKLGCALCNLNSRIGNNLGLCMLSKGGIALGFVLLIQTSPALEALRQDQQISAIMSDMVNIVLISIFVNEVISPFFLRHAVIQGNEMEV
ncbi:MAG: cation:proton antiporter [bacterium]